MYFSVENYPAIQAALVEIAQDSDGVAPSYLQAAPVSDLVQFSTGSFVNAYVPFGGQAVRVTPAEVESALASLKASSPEDFETFCVGEDLERFELIGLSPALQVANALLGAFFEEM